MPHPRRSAKDVLLCDSCETVSVQSHCELCNINLCTNCVDKHLLNSSKRHFRHNVIPFLHRKSTLSTPKRLKHVKKHCKIHSKSTSVSSGKHKGHNISEVKPLLGEPRLTATINTGYIRLQSVSCVSEEFWTRGLNETMKLLNPQGKLLAAVQTVSGKIPRDIAVTRNGDLVYIDYCGTVYLVKNKRLQTVITLQEWMPLNVCSTASDDLLITMVCEDEIQSKLVRYSGSTETQTIQFDDQGCLIYSPNYNDKYISENRNLDICVADWAAKAVVVVNQSGKLRFRYTGHPSDTELLFYPAGIATDSQSRILTADRNNDRIHILDQDGQFLCYIQNCGFYRPLGLCVDSRDNLFVAESVFLSSKLKRICYL